MKINCDIGERGIKNSTDIKLMKYIDIANVACGGHAGDIESSTFFVNLAKKHSVEISAHLSYPDILNFGRKTIIIDNRSLIDSLNMQLQLLKNIKLIKFHGALYNDTCSNSQLANTMAKWLKSKNIKTVLTMPDSELAKQCNKYGIIVKAEAFIERRYEYDPISKKINLRSRMHPDASIKTIQEAVEQFKDIFYKNTVCNIQLNSDKKSYTDLFVDTLCIHSDSEIALSLVKKIRDILNNEK